MITVTDDEVETLTSYGASIGRTLHLYMDNDMNFYIDQDNPQNSWAVEYLVGRPVQPDHETRGNG